MNRIPNTTNDRQSKVLLDAGLPAETADMVNATGPAWSLGKLISLMPDEVSYFKENVKVSEEEDLPLATCYNLRMNRNVVRYETWDADEEKFRAYGLYLIDAVVDAVVWLINEGWLEVMLEKEKKPLDF